MADLYRSRRRGRERWRYAEGKYSPTAALGLPESLYPKGSDKRAEGAQRWGFVCERQVDGEWVDCTEEFL